MFQHIFLYKESTMPTLIIYAPHTQVDQNQKRSFNQTIESQTGSGYVISRRLVEQLSPGDPIIVICKVHRKQASGQTTELKLTVKAGNGMQRYDVIMENLKSVSYSHGNTDLERTGVQVI